MNKKQAIIYGLLLSVDETLRLAKNYYEVGTQGNETMKKIQREVDAHINSILGDSDE